MSYFSFLLLFLRFQPILAGFLIDDRGDLEPAWNLAFPGPAHVVVESADSFKMYYSGADGIDLNLATAAMPREWLDYEPGNPLKDILRVRPDAVSVKYFAEGFAGANAGTFPSAVQMYYRMWYVDCCVGTESVSMYRYAESANGVVWRNQMAVTEFGTLVYNKKEAVLSPSFGVPDVVYTPGAANMGTDWSFKIYYIMQWGIRKQLCVFLAFSRNGYTWTGYDPTGTTWHYPDLDVVSATPIFDGSGISGTPDEIHITRFNPVVSVTPPKWLAFYSGSGPCGGQPGTVSGVGYALSTDKGLSWQRREILLNSYDDALAEWRSAFVWQPSAARLSDTDYVLWYLGSANTSLPDKPAWNYLGSATLIWYPDPESTSSDGWNVSSSIPHNDDVWFGFTFREFIILGAACVLIVLILASILLVYCCRKCRKPRQYHRLSSVDSDDVAQFVPGNPTRATMGITPPPKGRSMKRGKK